MNSLGRNNDGKGKKQSSVFTKETLGVVLVLFATLILVCLITRDGIFSVPGQYINAFLLGCFGYFAFALAALVVFEGILLVSEKRTGLTGKQKGLITLTLILVALLVHIVTMSGETLGYGDYLAKSYTMAENGAATCSGGGFFTAVIAYPLSLILSEIGSYVVLSILIVLSVYALIADFSRGARFAKKSGTEKFRGSYVEADTAVAPIANDLGLEVKDYPVAGVEFPDENENKKPAQKLFVNNAAGFGFKTNREIKNEEKNVAVKIQQSDSGLNVANAANKSYVDSYSTEMQKRLDYIKKPAQIDVEKTLSSAPSNYGVTVSKPIPTRPITPNNVTVAAKPVEPPVAKEPEKEPPTIPYYEHDEGSVDTAASRAEAFTSVYAKIEDVETGITKPVKPAEPVEIFRPRDISAVSAPNIPDIPKVEEIGKELPSEAEPLPSEIEKPTEEPITVENKPSESVVINRKTRGILFGGDDDENEKPSYTSRVESDNNGGRSRAIFVEEPPVQPVQSEPEPPKKEKKPVPINREYFRPPFDLLENHAQPVNAGQENHQERMDIIKRTLEEFRIDAIPQSYIQGPAFTRYEIMMPAGISVKKVLGYDDDLKMRLAAKDGVRIEAPIPGKNLVGIEVANTVKTMVGFKSVMEGLAANSKKGSLVFAVGKDIVGDSISYDLAKGPHYLIAGATGSGKSVCLHVMIVSLLMRYSPEELKLVLIDPKSVEFRKYDHIPHLLVDEIVTDAKRAITLLQWAYDETNRRNEMFTQYAAISNIDDYNSQIASDIVPKLPRIVFFIDELADLMETCKKDLEEKIRKIAAKSRSAGIHLVLATQRPSVDVITGTIKANLPSRIALRVMNFADSQTILGEAGAEKLLGNGDMLYKDSSMGNYERYQGAYISGREITNVVNYIKEHNKAYFDDDVKEFLDRETRPKQEESSSEHGEGVNGDGNSLDEFFLRALSLAVNSGTISISQLQRRFQIGYARAGGLVDKMERLGFVSGNEGSKARRVLITREEFEQKFGNISD